MATRERLIVLGGGDFARELLWAASRVPADRRTWEIYGVLDDEKAGVEARVALDFLEVPVLGSIAAHAPKPDERFICSIGSPRAKLAACEQLTARGARFANVVDPSAIVAPDATLGVGVFLFLGAVVSVGARLGDHVAVNCHATVGHDAVVGDGCTISSHCDVTGRVTLGRGAFLGSHASVLPRGVIGDFATVGAGSVVLKRLGDGESAIGVPARRL